MVVTTDIAGDIMSAATALSGLLLVFLGAVATAFDSYDSTAKAAFLIAFKRRAWFSLTGFLLALLSAGLAFVGKWLDSTSLVVWASICLGLSFVPVIAAAFSTVRDIRKP